MSEVDYLREYYLFDDEVMLQMEQVAADQRGLTWPEYVSRNNIPELKKYLPRNGQPIEVLDIAPKDYDGTIVYHMPMGCLLDANIILHVTTLADAAPNKRLISFSNPGQPGHGSSKLTRQEIIKVWQGDLRPAVGPSLEYVESEGIETAIHAGASYGADRTAASAENAFSYDHQVNQAVMIEPTSVKKRSLLNMGLTFLSTTQHTERYGEPLKKFDVFQGAQQYKESELLYPLGLARLSNLAIGHALGKTGFEGRVTRAMAQNSEMKSAIAWGSESEFALDALVLALTNRLASLYGEGRVSKIPLTGHAHAMNIDPYLNTALILQALKKT